MHMSRDHLRIVVLGYIVRGPLGGLVWHHLQYVIGLSRLGHDVYFIEDSGDSPWCCYDADRHVTDSDPSYGLRFAADTFRMAGLSGRWAYYDAHRDCWHGPASTKVPELFADADLLLNISGVNTLRPMYQAVPRRVLIDTDPAFMQLKHLTDPEAREEAARHTAFFTFAENFHSPTSTIPDDGFPWTPTRQPIVIDAWRVVPGPRDGAFTTVMQWDSYPAREYNGRLYGMKSQSFAPFLGLPGIVQRPLEIAVGGQKAYEALAPHGWVLRNPLELTRTAVAYQEYIRRSKGEFTVAKHGYVASGSGWFSERSAAYLASGRPVVAQETGFSDWLATGNGLHAFASPEEAAAAIRKIDDDYDAECRAARAVAAEFFSADRVLSSLIERSTSVSTVDVAASAHGR
jgi:hypothetical protein